MEEIIEKIDNLIKELEKQEEIIEIKKVNEELKKDKELKNLIERYKEDKSLLKEIENNKLFQKYKEKETDLNILILKINKRLQEITNKGNCHL